MGQKLKSELGKATIAPGPGNYDLMNRDNAAMRGGARYSMGTGARGSVVSKSIS